MSEACLQLNSSPRNVAYIVTRSYADYLEFFSAQISTAGITNTLERYIFALEGAMMFIRMFSGFYNASTHLAGGKFNGIEFGQDYMVAQGNYSNPSSTARYNPIAGLAQAAVTYPGGLAGFEMPSGLPTFDGFNPRKSASLLELLRD
ncbi:hypothetical protein DFH07DRAFT_784447 [Mycena maculata]|uniref:Uncharacterized protein n=1 Tax=Mycena maculata TaxID=230809 RepID=A0AAD7HI09_9AGAR|nr:hypothetical protein DFH07DRAFT_784447 [Mycena maculata]